MKQVRCMICHNDQSKFIWIPEDEVTLGKTMVVDGDPWIVEAKFGDPVDFIPKREDAERTK